MSIGQRTLTMVFVLVVTATAQADDAPESGKSQTAVQTAVKKTDFARDIQPIFARHCAKCHGALVQKARLRLDAKKIVFKGGKTGPALVPGKSAESLLVQRIEGRGGDAQMPKDAEPLSQKEIALIRAWIDTGARWPDGVGVDVDEVGKHWAYVKPERPSLPAVKKPDWIRDSLDAFTLARIEQAGLQPSPEAKRERLIRRVTLDLIGMPPTIEEIDAFLADDRPGAYERLVERLLASPRYGERWAIPWLDAARYADSNGYQRDGRRVYWAYRDWVINALNEDMPFDRFTIEQIAGDLLPNPTLQQVIATGFHRGTMANVEAGTDPEEQRVLAIFDRVNTTGTVWLGTTINCMQCHAHKYDPFSQEEYYGLFAFFNSTGVEIESNKSSRDFTGPKIELPLPPMQQQQYSNLQSQIATVGESLATLTAQLKEKQSAWEQELAATLEHKAGWQVLTPRESRSEAGTTFEELEDHSLLATGTPPGRDVYTVTAETGAEGITAVRLEVLTHDSFPGGGPGRVEPGNFILSEFKIEAASRQKPEDFQPVPVADVFADYSQENCPVEASLDGDRKTCWAIGRQFGRGHYAVFVLKDPLTRTGGALLRFTLDQQYGRSRLIGRFQLQATTGDPQEIGLPKEIRKIVTTPADKRTDKQTKQLTDHYLDRSANYKQIQTRITKLQAQLKIVAPDTSLVMKELSEPRVTRRFKRGDFLNPEEEIPPGTPQALHPLKVAEGQRPNRLDLARWLVDEENPLVARVTVNRHWAEFFGRGIVETPEEFGAQGDPPTHPLLLDWLATEFVSSGWSVKQLHRRIVTSATYRQSSRVTPKVLAADPYNKLYARGPRFRLKAEYIRDNALAVAGLLSTRMHGPPIFPVQPTGVWNHIGRASNLWTTSAGENLYRRGVYVNWRRTVPYPSFVAFDAPSREMCSVKRDRSNTPLQALALLNDPVYIEAAAALARRTMSEPPQGASAEDRVRWAFRLATGRRARSEEVAILLARYKAERERYRNDLETAKKLTAKWPKPNGDLAEYAAWIHVTNILLNLDEVITKG